MENNPFKQNEDNKLNADREFLRKNLGDIFDNKETQLIYSIDNFISKTEILERNGLNFNKEEIINGLRESINIKDKETFISHLLKTLDPILVSKITQADVYKKADKEIAPIARKETMSEPGHIILSEFLYCDLEKNAVRLHLAAGYDFITREKVEDFNKDIINGLEKLAKIIEPMKNINKIVASSWILAKRNPRRLKELGFTIEGEISEEEKSKYFSNDNRKIFKAYIDRQKFDELYLNN